MNRRHTWLAGLAAAALALLTVSSVFGYAGEVAASVTISGPSGILKCNTPITLNATVLDADGKPIEGQPVDWELIVTISSADTLSSTTSTTNASGVATTTVTLACVLGDREVRTTADDVSGNLVLSITAAGLPGTSTVTDGSPAGTPPFAPLIALLAVLAGAGIMVRRVVLNSR